MQAVDLERFGMMLFSTVPVEGPIRDELEEGLGARIIDGVTLEERPDLRGLPTEESRPEALLCVSRDDPGRYLVVPYRDQVEPLGCDVVRRSYNVIESEKGWRTFLEAMRSLTAHAQAATGVEPPDSPEVP